jgi:ketol-acid reductoisomerase
MPKPIFRDNDIDLNPLLSKKVVIIGYGNQGRPHAMNLRDSGVTVKIGARPASRKKTQAQEDGFEVLSIPDSLAWADIVMLLMPDDVMADVYNEAIAPYMRKGQYLGFCHGLVIHAEWLKPDAGLNVFLAAPKGQGRGVRNKYLAGTGVPGLYGVHQDPSGDTQSIALAYLKALGCARVGVMPTTFAEETICDLFSEQTVLCGGLTSLVKTAFETLVERGFSEEVAYFECLYEVKLIADLLHERGINGMREAISSTALYGDLKRGDYVIDGHVRENMRVVLDNILSGQFACDMRSEFTNGKPFIRQQLLKDENHAIERTHRDLRERLHFGEA